MSHYEYTFVTYRNGILQGTGSLLYWPEKRLRGPPRGSWFTCSIAAVGLEFAPIGEQVHNITSTLWRNERMPAERSLLGGREHQAHRQNAVPEYFRQLQGKDEKNREGGRPHLEVPSKTGERASLIKLRALVVKIMPTLDLSSLISGFLPSRHSVTLSIFPNRKPQSPRQDASLRSTFGPNSTPTFFLNQTIR
jgi:hypothetical protein